MTNDLTNNPSGSPGQEILRVQDLYKSFALSRKQQKLEKTADRRRIAVNGISFSAYQGEVFGLLGPNGAGKTTTLRMISTLLRPERGDITVEGFSVSRQPEQVRQRIGFLTSELKLEDFFTPNYLFSFFSQLHGVPAALREQRRADLFERFGINEFAEVKVAELSTGMKQKVSLAISLVHDPDIIIFDEPTNGLDVLTARVVTDFLLDLKAAGKSIIVSTHIFSLIERICDRVGIIIDGRMVCCAPLAELCGGLPLEERFFRIYAEQAADEAARQYGKAGERGE